MTLPAVRYLVDNAAKTFRRFPYSLCTAVGACLLFWWMVGEANADPAWVKVLLTLALGVPLMFSLTLMRERPPFGRRIPAIVYGPLGFLLIGLLLITLLRHPAPNFSIYYIQWLVPSIVLVTFSAYFGCGEVDGFWHFNQLLVTRAIVSGLYAAVLFAGVSVVLLAIDELLGVDIKPEAYPRIWAFAAFVFFPWHFLAGVPAEFGELQRDDSYPKALKVFTQFLLVPLASVYFLILYLYLGKILFTQQWPSGWVAWLTTSASLLGLVTFVMLFPVRDREGNAWIARYSKGFCLSALPLLGMLFVSIYKRTEEYGLTERRCFLVVLALWLLFTFLYFILSKAPDIRWMPATFCIVAALTSFGPWGVYEISFRSQKSRLEALLARNGMWAAGKAVKATKDVSWEDRKQISACLDYVSSYHGLKRLQPMFRENLDHAAGDARTEYWGGGEATKKVMGPLGLRYVSPLEKTEDDHGNASYTVEDRAPLDVEGYATGYAFDGFELKHDPCPAKGNQVAVVSVPALVIRFCREGTAETGPSLNEMLDRLTQRPATAGPREGVSRELMTVEGNGMKVYFRDLTVTRKGKEKAIVPIRGAGILFLKRR